MAVSIKTTHELTITTDFGTTVLELTTEEVRELYEETKRIIGITEEPNIHFPSDPWKIPDVWGSTTHTSETTSKTKDQE